jgi:hypothetical protein
MTMQPTISRLRDALNSALELLAVMLLGPPAPVPARVRRRPGGQP